jgi:RNA polymerase sigma-70 factor (ECF subfamily)
MHEFEEIPLQDIALELEIPEGTVSTRLRLGRHDLEVALQRFNAARRTALERSGVRVLPVAFTLETLIRTGREWDEPPEGALERVWARLQADALPASPHLVGGKHGGPGTTGAAVLPAILSPTPFTVGALVLVGTFALGVVVGGAVMAALLVRWSDAAPGGVAGREEDPPAARTLSPQPLSAPTVVPTSSSASTAPDVRAGPAPGEGIAEERRLIQQAKQALGNDALDTARALLEQHAKRFPRGKHAAERRALQEKIDAAPRERGTSQ